MYLVTFNFLKNLPTDDQLIRHRAYIDEKVQQGIILLGGPKEPRTGGIMLVLLDQEEQVRELIEADPYFLEKLAEFETTKFNPVKYRPEIEKLINKK